MNLFEEKDCSVTVYALAAMAAFGPECLEWDPLILRDAFQDEFGCKLHQKGFDKLQAGLSMVGTNLFTHSIETFLACTALCNNKPVKQSELSYVTLKDCCWAVFCWRQLLGEAQDSDQQFDPDIVLYIQALMNKDGISQLPQFMSFAQLEPQQLHRIQQNLISDTQAFQAYSKRQYQNVQEIKSWIKDKQAQLMQQLRRFQQIMENKRSPFQKEQK